MPLNISRGPVDGMINVHIVSHTHDDTGWLKSVDQYYFQEVRYILDTVVDSLLNEPYRKFNYVEMAFFSRWWEDQSPRRKEAVRRLVHEKRLIFLNGGWCMHDEAGPLYTEMIDQTTRGHQFILKEFGPDAAPNATWQVDPFGHSNTQASLLSAEAGMPALFWGRMNENDRNVRRKNKGLEYIWEGSYSLGSSSQTFAGELWGVTGGGSYMCPFNFEFMQYDHDGIQDDPRRHDYNVQEFVEKAVQKAIDQHKEYRTSHIMWACGMDFNYHNADTWFYNLDRLMHHARMDGRINLFYSSPADYTQAKNRDQEEDWEIRQDDLMNLKERDHAYWTGYFSSRVAFKRLLRKSSNLLTVGRQVQFLTKNQYLQATTEHVPPVVGSTWTDAFESSIAVATHHDGVSGTAKQAVNDDYAQRISESQVLVEAGIQQGLNTLLHEGKHEDKEFVFCQQLNISVCDFTTASSETGFTVTAWNPLAHKLEDYQFQIPVRVDKDGLGFEVFVTGTDIINTKAQLLPLDSRTKELPLLYLNWYGLSKNQADTELQKLKNHATHNLVFSGDLPPLGAASFIAKPSRAKVAKNKDNFKTEYSNGVYSVTLNSKTHAVERIKNLETGVETSLDLQWGWYESNEGGKSSTGDANSASGAYIFRPQTSTFHYPGRKKSEIVETQVVSGSLVTEIRQKISPWASHVIRLKKGTPYVEIEFTAGPIPLSNEWLEDHPKAGKHLGKELALRYKTSLASRSTFYTDSNGREMMKRVRNQRPASYPQPFDFHDEPIAGNYYPVNSMIALEEPGEAQMCIITDSTQGGTSLRDGELELMVLRRVLHDDAKGVGEPLNETMCGCNGKNDPTCLCHGLAVRGTHKIILDTPENANAMRRKLNLATQFEPLVFFSSLSSENSRVLSYSALNDALPDNIRLLTISQNYAAHQKGATLIRFEHIYAVDEHPEYSKPVHICLQEVFAKHGTIAEVVETTLTANRRIEDKPTFTWKTDLASQTKPKFETVPLNQTRFILNPMAIRTFLVKFDQGFTELS